MFSSLKILNQVKWSSLSIFFLLLSLGACKKDIETSKLVSDSYIHAFPAQGDQLGWFITPSDNGGCLAIFTDEILKNLIIYKLDDKGLIESKDTLKGLEMYYPVFTELNDGNILIVSGYNNGNFCKLNKQGKVQFISSFSGTGLSNSYPILMRDGSIAIASSTGWRPGLSSQINFLNSDGTDKGNVVITDASFGNKFKTLYTSLQRCDTIGTYYFNGACFPNWNQSFRSRPKLFLAKQRYSGVKLMYSKTIIIDSTDQNYSYSGVYQVTTKDNHTILAASFADINSINKGKILKIDADLNINWEKTLQIGLATACTGVTECPDGNYLITGVCFVADKSVNQPFACKMDKNGVVIWQKIYSTKLYGQFSWGIQAADGSLFFTGNTSGFGAGSTLSDVFIVKTDIEGKLK